MQLNTGDINLVHGLFGPCKQWAAAISTREFGEVFPAAAFGLIQIWKIVKRK